MKVTLKHSRLLICIAVLSIVIHSYACAQPIPPTCDADYYDVLNARSYLEGKREMEAAQRLILKPDSVLEYSCFNEDLLHVGTSGGSFSSFGFGTAIKPPEFDGTPPPTRVLPNSLSDSLMDVVHYTLVEFLYSFRHVYLGGTISIAPSPLAGCNPMNVVWHAAKCETISPLTWVKLENLDSVDIRLFPWPCDPYDPGRGARISAAYAAAYPPPATPAASGGMDATDGYINDLTGSCGGSMAIPTGVQFQFPPGPGPTYDDAVCIKPKCAYDGAGSCS